MIDPTSSTGSEVDTSGGGISRTMGRLVFGQDAAGYDSSRPGYPEELYHAIQARFVAPIRAIGEIGAGTGIATARLYALDPIPERYVVFEPDPQLCAFLEKRFPGIEILQCDFCTARTAGPFDLIVAASAFHWLDPKRALPKARRLLRPGGQLALWWNIYAGPPGLGPLAEAVKPLLGSLPMPPSISRSDHYSLNEEFHRGQLEGGGFIDIKHRLFAADLILSPERARGLYGSFSFIRVLPTAERNQFLDAVESIVLNDFSGSAEQRILSSLYLAASPPA